LTCFVRTRCTSCAHRAVAMSGNEGNHKNTLNGILQRITALSMGKDDIAYETVKHEDEYQCTVTMMCLDNKQVSGEMSADSKASEQNAALQAIEALQGEFKGLGHSVELSERSFDIPESVQLAAVQAGLCPTKEEATDAMTDFNIKAMLSAVVKKVLDRNAEKGEIVYDFEQASLADRLYVAKMKIPNLPNKLGQTTWSSKPSPFKRDAQLDAILQAMDAILSDEIAANIDLEGAVRSASDKKKSDKRRTKDSKQLASSGPLGIGGKGGSKGKGKKGDSGWEWDMMNMMMTMMYKGMEKGFKGKDMGFGKGKGKGKDKGKGKTKGPRTRIEEELATGDVVEWKGKFGWIQPHMPVPHADAEKNGGRLFVSGMDAPDGSLDEGQTVTFNIYSDGNGLGAENVSVM